MAILPSAESKIVKAKSKLFMVVLVGYTGLKESEWVVWFWLVNLCEGSRTNQAPMEVVGSAWVLF